MSPLFLRFLVVAQLAVAGIGLVVVEPDNGSESVSTGQPGATSTTAAPGDKFGAPGPSDEPTASTAAPATTATSAPGSTATTKPAPAAAKPPPTTATTRAAAQGLTPAKAGTYEYRVTYTDDEGSETSTGRFTLEAAKQQDGETRQTEVDVEDDVTTTTSYAWRPDGLYVRSITSEGSTCDLEPDILVVASPSTVGRSWRIDTSCTEEGETIELKGTSRIVRTDRMAVSGRQVDVVVIETTISGGDMEFTGRQFFAPAHGIVVRDETTYDDGSSDLREVLNVDPK